MSKATAGVLCEVAAERERQDTRWGEQNHASGTGAWGWGDGEWEEQPALAEIRRDHAEADKAACAEFARDGRLSWRNILRKEVSEAIAEDEGEALRRELVQVAAVAVAWIECIDRRASAPSPGADHEGGREGT